MKKILNFLFLITIVACNQQQEKEITCKDGFPFWSKDLIIYEVAIKGFTSPDGPESGTFNSLREKIPYLSDLGINGIWLSGHNLADSNHFYNIWTQYATIRQDSVDPSLGSVKELKSLVAEAHNHDIKVFFDVITHGVMDYSPLIKEHPEWFKGGSWGMTDFDWFGGHDDLDRWWVDTWLRYILDIGVDGFRIDCDIYRPDLWAEIKHKAKQAGKDIIVFVESPVRFPGASDSRQYVINIASHNGLVSNHPFVTNPAKHLNKLFNYRKSPYTVEIVKHGSQPDTLFPGDDRLTAVEYSMKKINDSNQVPYYICNTKLRLVLNNAPDSLVGVKVTRFNNGFEFYGQHWWADFETHHKHPAWPTCWLSGDTLFARFPEVPPQNELTFLQISCHDGGWEGFPQDKNPYSVQGSRCVIGYSGLLTPTVPIIFSGEEFNHDYRALPSLKPSLFGDKGNAGSGRWMYGAWLDWEQLNNKENQEMLEDVKKIIRIRKQEQDLFNGYALQSGVNIIPIYAESDTVLPMPFMVYNHEKALIVAGNNTAKDVNLTLNIPVRWLPFKPQEMINLWTNKACEFNTKLNVKVKADKTKGGGIAIYKIR